MHVDGAGDPERDREILSLLYNTTGGADWQLNEGWGGGDDLSLWFGVTVNDTTGTVEELDLTKNNLQGMYVHKVCRYGGGTSLCIVYY